MGACKWRIKIISPTHFLLALWCLQNAWFDANILGYNTAYFLRGRCWEYLWNGEVSNFHLVLVVSISNPCKCLAGSSRCHTHTALKPERRKWGGWGEEHRVCGPKETDSRHQEARLSDQRVTALCRYFLSNVYFAGMELFCSLVVRTYVEQRPRKWKGKNPVLSLRREIQWTCTCTRCDSPVQLQKLHGLVGWCRARSAVPLLWLRAWPLSDNARTGPCHFWRKIHFSTAFLI